MEYQVLSVRVKEFTDKQTGEKKTMYQCYIALDDGGVGSAFSARAHDAGDIVALGVRSTRDGGLAVRILD